METPLKLFLYILGALTTYSGTFQEEMVVPLTINPTGTTPKATSTTSEATSAIPTYIKEKQRSNKYKKKYILTKDSLKECDRDKNAEVCYRYARIFNLLKYEKEAKKYYELSCEYGLNIACDVDMEEDLKRENTTNYLREYDLIDDIKLYNNFRMYGGTFGYDCNGKPGNYYKNWWENPRNNVAVCYAMYENAIDEGYEDETKEYKQTICILGYTKYCGNKDDNSK